MDDQLYKRVAVKQRQLEECTDWGGIMQVMELACLHSRLLDFIVYGSIAFPQFVAV